MEGMTIEEIKNAVKGEFLNKYKTFTIKGISIDSRKISPGDLYIPIKGERFDGHDFIGDAIEKGAVAYLTEKKGQRNIGLPILVNNTLKALQQLALYYRQKFDIPFIAITGSSGKTTTKDILASVLGQKYNVLKTQGNFNNEIGLPLTLFQIESHHQIGVIEMGMSNLGEISKLVNMVIPDVAVITNIGFTHIERLGSKENIFKAKKEILETLNNNQLALLNGDDEYLSGIKNDRFKVALVGINHKGLNLKAENIISKGDRVSFFIREEDAAAEEYQIKLPGIHNIYNSLFAIYLGKFYGLSPGEIQSGLNSFKPSQMRMDIFLSKNIKIINDSYNANPDSMKAALEVLRDIDGKGRKVAILGDMLELGQWAERAHFDIGKTLGEFKIDVLITIGEWGNYYIAGAVENGLSKNNGRSFRSNQDTIKFLHTFLKDGDTLLIKGSRGLKMEEIATYFKEEF